MEQNGGSIKFKLDVLPKIMKLVNLDPISIRLYGLVLVGIVTLQYNI